MEISMSNPNIITANIILCSGRLSTSYQRGKNNQTAHSRMAGWQNETCMMICCYVALLTKNGIKYI